MNNDNLEMKKFMAAELNKGVSLSDLQKELVEKFNCKMTFLELRLLAAELENIDWSKQDPVKPAAEEAEKAKEAVPVAGKTVVEKSKLVRPGAMANGTVKFASGATAEWILDSYGRLGLDNVNGEYTEDDIKEFQAELQNLFASGR
ncbi:hypothetical protein [Victivallis sp. Marseille-Q1083]|uniref:hypothetical protein n=1 Tax=Victivallis sp. Marseille-Q1083 TaxID=2717288 RepID=UPI00158F10AC|nr:hypothetical protein [Victivallis sp. Marseille-Q1083]